MIDKNYVKQQLMLQFQRYWYFRQSRRKWIDEKIHKNWKKINLLNYHCLESKLDKGAVSLLTTFLLYIKKRPMMINKMANKARTTIKAAAFFVLTCEKE